MIVERTHYWAKEGARDAVLATRRKASAVRVAIGLPAGEIRAKADPAADGPDVVWECAFPDRAAREADLAARGASPEFEAVRKEIGPLLARFERLCEEIVGGWSPDPTLAGRALAPVEHEFASGGRRLKGYLWLPLGVGPFACVIHNHGSGVTQGTDDAVQPGVAAELLAWGYAVVYPHRHGYGNSPGPDWRSECPGEPFSESYNRGIVARLERESLDVLAAFAFLRTLPAIDASRVAVMGSSFGGVNTLLAIERESALRCGVEFAGAAMNWDPNPLIAARLIAAARATTRPVFYAQAANDFSIRPTRELAAAAAAAGRHHAWRIYPAFGLTPWEGHLVHGRGIRVWRDDVRRFLERWL